MEDALEESETHWKDNLAGGAESHGYTRIDGIFAIWSDSDKHPASTFISGAWGVQPTTVGDLETQIEADHGDSLQLKEGQNWCRLDGYDGGETQYGMGYGDTYRIGGYWDYEVIEPAKAKALIEVWLRREYYRISAQTLGKFVKQECWK